MKSPRLRHLLVRWVPSSRDERGEVASWLVVVTALCAVALLAPVWLIASVDTLTSQLTLVALGVLGALGATATTMIMVDPGSPLGLVARTAAGNPVAGPGSQTPPDTASSPSSTPSGLPDLPPPPPLSPPGRLGFRLA